eukprot:Trichotokara_eunicae@DN1775_c0_g1_i1.p1
MRTFWLLGVVLLSGAETIEAETSQEENSDVVLLSPTESSEDEHSDKYDGPAWAKKWVDFAHAIKETPTKRETVVELLPQKPDGAIPKAMIEAKGTSISEKGTAFGNMADILIGVARSYADLIRQAKTAIQRAPNAKRSAYIDSTDSDTKREAQ